MNTILGCSSRMRSHTDIDLVFQSFQGRQKKFNWLITDFECYPSEALGSCETKPLWFTGEQLTEIVSKQRIQFVWAVLSGFDPNTTINPNSLEVEPRAEGHPTVWTERPTIQHPNAKVEIICCDSTFTILLSQDNDLSLRFRNFFPEATDLDEYNAASGE
ncbi:MAG TPA: hypothetical protein V6D29_02835 [Leptolyngbyaceae cyanobacterium]